MKKSMVFLLAIFTMFASTFFAFAFAAEYTSIEDLAANYENKTDDSEQETPTSITAKREFAKQEFNAVKKHLRFSSDKVEDINWTQTKWNISSYYPYIDIYVGEDGKRIWMRLKAELREDLPVLTKQIIFNIDGSVYRLPVNSDCVSVKSDISTSQARLNSTVTRLAYTETIDMHVTPDIHKILLLIPKSKDTTVRLSGQSRYIDFKIPKATKNAFDAMLRFYEARPYLQLQY